MIKIKKIILALLFLSFYLHQVSFGQEVEWEREISENGNTEVFSKVYDAQNKDGEEVKFIEYKVKTFANTTLDKCYKVFRNSDLHKKFYEYTEESRKIKDLNENEWIIYYIFDPPWPIPNNDNVSIITMTRDTAKNNISFKSVAKPDLIEMTDMSRSQMNEIEFTFTETSVDSVEISIVAKLAPVVSAPSWMINSWFPDGPAGTIQRLKALVEDK